jgi:hypothetical protein
MAYDRARRLWEEAGWPWPEEFTPLRGDGKAAADPAGVRAFSDQENKPLRERIKASAKLQELLWWPGTAWWSLGCGLRSCWALKSSADPGAMPVAVVSRSMVSNKDKSKTLQEMGPSPDKDC